MRTLGLFLAGAAVGALACLAAPLLGDSTKEAPKTPKTDAAPKEAASRYAFHQEKYIHPLVVGAMVGSSPETETVCSLNLSSPYMFDLFDNLYRLGGPLDTAKELLEFDVKERGGRTWVEWEGEHGAFLMYSHIGTSPSGVEIIEFRESGGGSGVFVSAAFFKIESRRSFPDNNERTELTILGKIWLGDRYKGQIVYQNGKLHIPVNESRFGPGGPRDESPLSVPIDAQAEAAPYAFHQPDYVHPLIVQDMLGSLADLHGSVVCVDLDAGNDSNRYHGAYAVVKRGGNEWVEWKGTQRESFRYRHIGTSPSGVHMIVCYDSGGGSGVFGSAALFRMETDRTLVENRKRTLLKLLDAISLGDRYDGSIAYEDGTLMIGADEGRFKGMGGPRDGKPLSIPVP